MTAGATRGTSSNHTRPARNDVVCILHSCVVISYTHTTQRAAFSSAHTAVALYGVLCFACEHAILFCCAWLAGVQSRIVKRRQSSIRASAAVTEMCFPRGTQDVKSSYSLSWCMPTAHSHAHKAHWRRRESENSRTHYSLCCGAHLPRFLGIIWMRLVYSCAALHNDSVVENELEVLIRYVCFSMCALRTLFTSILTEENKSTFKDIECKN